MPITSGYKYKLFMWKEKGSESAMKRDTKINY